MQGSHSWVIHGPPDLLLTWQTVQIKLILCSVYRQNWNFQPRFPSLKCSELKQNVNWVNKKHGFWAKEARCHGCLIIACHQTSPVPTKLAQSWIRSGSAGQLMLSVSLGHNHTQAPCLPPYSIQTWTAFMARGTVGNCSQCSSSLVTLQRVGLLFTVGLSDRVRRVLGSHSLVNVCAERAQPSAVQVKLSRLTDSSLGHKAGRES